MKLSAGFKQTDVGVIPEDWDVRELREIGVADWGNTTVTKSAYTDHGYLAFSASGPDGFVSWFEHDKPAVVISAIGAQCGKTWLAQGKWTPIKNTIWFRSDEARASIEFLFRATGDPDFWPKSGQAQPFVSVTNVRRARLALPPTVAEQRAIAAALSDSDALIASLDALIAKKRDLKQAAMQQLFTGKTRLPGFTSEWKVKRLGELCSMRSGEGITAKSIDEFSPYPCFGGNGLRGFTTSFTHEGSFCLIGRVGALCGNLLLVSGRFFASEHAIVVSAQEGTDIRWLTLALGTLGLNRRAESSAQPVLTVSKLAILELNCPPTNDEQAAIAKVFSDMDTELAALDAQREKARALKQGMMQELLTGRIRLV